MSSCRWKKNFYEIDEGKFYRSAQLTREELIEVTTSYGIRTIINLRGFQHDKPWYPIEISTAEELGLQMITIPMDAHRLPHRDHLLKLLRAFQTALRPILVHCKSGSDRAGEATAIYQMEYMGLSKDEALKSLAPKYLHFSLFTPAKTYFIKLYKGIEWARWEYAPCFQKYKYYDPPDFCRAPPPPFPQMDHGRIPSTRDPHLTDRF